MNPNDLIYAFAMLFGIAVVLTAAYEHLMKLRPRKPVYLSAEEHQIRTERVDRAMVAEYHSTIRVIAFAVAFVAFCVWFKANSGTQG